MLTVLHQYQPEDSRPSARRDSAMLTITVNAEPRSFPGPLTVADLLRQLDKDPQKLAVEVNRDVVPRTDHPTRQLRDGDAVEIVTLVGGGSGEPAPSGASGPP